MRVLINVYCCIAVFTFNWMIAWKYLRIWMNRNNWNRHDKNIPKIMFFFLCKLCWLECTHPVSFLMISSFFLILLFIYVWLLCFCVPQSDPSFSPHHFRTFHLCTSQSFVRHSWDAPCLLLWRRYPATVSHPSRYQRTASTDPAGPWAESCSTLCLSWPSSIRIGTKTAPAASVHLSCHIEQKTIVLLYPELLDKWILKNFKLAFAK